MRRSVYATAFRWLSLSFILSAMMLAGLQWQGYRQLQGVLPSGSMIAGVPVGGLTRDQAAERLNQAYGTPVELRYQKAVILLAPGEAGFQLDADGMLAAAQQGARVPPWDGFVRYLQGSLAPAIQVPLQASFSETRLRDYLNSQIVPRYDQSAIPPMPALGSVDWTAGAEGVALDVEAAVPLIEKAVQSLDHRVVDLPVRSIPAPPASLQNLEIVLKETIDAHGFDGLVGLYFRDMQSPKALSIAYQDGQTFSTDPDVAFTAASIMKVPIMISVFRGLDGPPDSETDKLLKDMIEESGNEAADWVMQRVIDPDFAPLEVTDNLHDLGLESTFLAGYFYAGAPLLQVYKTPANQRKDAFTDPDIYSQTTPSDMATLLEGLYRCNQSGLGLLVDTFPGQITQQECQSMLTYLAGNKTPYLIEAGVPEVLDVIHKHGWVSYQGVINAIGDAALVYTPQGDYVLTIFVHRTAGLLWESTSRLVSDLSRAVYNFYSLP
jgi:beta-lactamase class A